MDINTCTVLTDDYRTIAYYSHLIPVAITLILSVFVIIKSKFSLLSRSFALFIFFFSLWLIGDVILWTVPNYYLVTAVWAPLDYINVLFYLAGVCFYLILINDGKDIPLWNKICLIALTLPAAWITFNGQSIESFNQTVCEANNSEFLGSYKFAIEMLSLGIVMFAGVFASMRGNREKKKQAITVGVALMLFFGIFSSTEYIASQTGIYEINLYSLFILPIFLAMIIFSITNLRIFAFRTFGTQLLIYILLIMVGSQFFFIKDTTNQLLTLITLVLSAFLGVVLTRNINAEEKARVQIEKLASELQVANTKLKELDKQKTEFLSFASHQVKNPLTALKGYASMALEGDYGVMSNEVTKVFKTMFDSSQSLIAVVQDFLDVTKIEAGGMQYDMKEFDLSKMVTEIVAQLGPNATIKNLKFDANVPAEPIIVNGDATKLRQVFVNLVDNSIKYTLNGSVRVSLEKNDKVVFKVKDTGVGIEKADIDKLFTKFSRADAANKVNVSGTGLGLYLARQIVEAHKGRVWVESEGSGKGSTFFVDLPI